MPDTEERARIAITASAIHNTKRFGEFRICVARNPLSNDEHVVLAKGSIAGGEAVICRLQSECVTGTVLDAATCECRDQLDLSLEIIQREGRGLLILLRQEGRGYGLTHKIKALANKNAGYDTFTAVEMLGDKADIREYRDAAEILRLMNVSSVHLLTNNPGKIEALTAHGVNVERVSSLNIPATEHTIMHLRAKKDRGHMIEL